jgi:hypothetical protein
MNVPCVGAGVCMIRSFPPSAMKLGRMGRSRISGTRFSFPETTMASFG